MKQSVINLVKLLSFSVLFVFAAVTVQSDEIDLPSEILEIVGDPEYGEYLASDCKTCHKVTGSAPGVPSIMGVYKRDLVIALHAYKQNVRKNPVMRMMAKRLSNEEIAALAAYFEGLN